jgi:outer membrane protein assembly factor BamE (lipoprotein component of BamABCDE complex)
LGIQAILEGLRTMIRNLASRDERDTKPLRLWRLAVVAATVLSAGGGMAGCATTITKHGHQFQEQDLQQVSTGMSQDQVRMSLGSPATTAALGQSNAYYYISSTMQQTAFWEPKEIDRKVVAVYFTPAGTVERVASYGIKDGRVFDFLSSTTPAANTREEGIIRQLFRNIGQRQIGGE